MASQVQLVCRILLSMELAEKTCLVTGGTLGIGTVALREFARRGAQIFMVVRNRSKGEALIQNIRAEVPDARLELLIGDLSLQSDIRRVASEFLGKETPLHLLLNNAGVMQLGHPLTDDGIDFMFAVNHLAYFLLTNLLLERMKASAPARIVSVASEAHRPSKIDFDDVEGLKVNGIRNYGRTKLANILFTKELARRLDGSGVTANCVHPGYVRTALGTHHGAWATALAAVGWPFARTPERGAETSIYLSTSAEVEGVSGQYFMDSKPKQPNAFSESPEHASRLWEVSRKLTGLQI